MAPLPPCIYSHISGRPLQDNGFSPRPIKIIQMTGPAVNSIRESHPCHRVFSARAIFFLRVRALRERTCKLPFSLLLSSSSSSFFFFILFAYDLISATTSGSGWLKFRLEKLVDWLEIKAEGWFLICRGQSALVSDLNIDWSFRHVSTYI